MPELRTARENACLETVSQRGRNSHQIGVLGIYDLQELSYGRTELLVADIYATSAEPGDLSDTRVYDTPPCREVPLNGHIRVASLGQ